MNVSDGYCAANPETKQVQRHVFSTTVGSAFAKPVVAHTPSSLAYASVRSIDNVSFAPSITQQIRALGSSQRSQTNSLTMPQGFYNHEDTLRESYVNHRHLDRVTAPVPFQLRPESSVTSVAQQTVDQIWFKSVEQSEADALYSDGIEQLKMPGITLAEGYCASRPYFLKAASLYHHAKSMYRLAVIEREGFLGQPNEQRALSWLSKAADHDEPRSLFLLGQYYYEQGGEFLKKSLKLLERASELNHPLASKALAQHYRKDVNDNGAKAQHYHALAETQHVSRHHVEPALIQSEQYGIDLLSIDLVGNADDLDDYPSVPSPCFGRNTISVPASPVIEGLRESKTHTCTEPFIR